MDALDTVPEASQPAVAKAALAIIRDQLKVRREKQRTVKKTGKASSVRRKPGDTA